jgi:hypothetical protein
MERPLKTSEPAANEKPQPDGRAIRLHGRVVLFNTQHLARCRIDEVRLLVGDALHRLSTQ